MKKFLFILTLFLTIVFSGTATEPLNIAGVYECDVNTEGVRKQMYLTLDFINGTPDFTQIFTGKESTFKSLPKDFMNAKKLKRTFAGTSAPGFGKFKGKLLFSNTSEFKITNPRNVNGVIVADWIDASSGKGECKIIVNPDRSIQILGLTNFTRDISPDNIVLGLVEDRLPEGMQAFVTPPAVSEFVIGEYRKSTKRAKVTSFDNEIEMQVVRAEQKGTRVEIEMRLRNISKYEKLDLVICHNNGEKCEAIAQNGKVFSDFSAETPGSILDHAAVQALKGKWVSFKVFINNVNERVDYFKQVKIDFGIAGGFFVDNPFTVIENLPVLQEMPDEIKPGYEAKPTNDSASLVELIIPSGKYALVLGDNVNLRAEPSSSSTIEGKVDKGEVLDFVASEKGWLKVKKNTNDNPVYISPKVARLVATAPLALNSTDKECPISYIYESITKKEEKVSNMVFSGTPDNIEVSITNGSYANGKENITKFFYKGYIEKGYVILIDKKIGENGKWEKLSSPGKIYAGEAAWTLLYDGIIYDAYQYEPVTDQGWKLSK